MGTANELRLWKAVQTERFMVFRDSAKVYLLRFFFISVA
jgi:hypothetical protein